MFNFNRPYDFELTTRFGIDKMKLMLKFMHILEPEADLDKRLAELKSFINEHTKRELTDRENLDLLKGLHAYIHSEIGSNERMESIDYILGIKFIAEDSTETKPQDNK